MHIKLVSSRVLLNSNIPNKPPMPWFPYIGYYSPQRGPQRTLQANGRTAPLLTPPPSRPISGSMFINTHSTALHVSVHLSTKDLKLTWNHIETRHIVAWHTLHLKKLVSLIGRLNNYLILSVLSQASMTLPLAYRWRVTLDSTIIAQLAISNKTLGGFSQPKMLIW